MGEIRRYFDAKFGTGKLVSRSRDTDSDVIQTLVGYQWMVGTTMLELFYFSAERGPIGTGPSAWITKRCDCVQHPRRGGSASPRAMLTR